MINPIDSVPRKTLRVLGNRISVAYVGSGPPILFIHGNATYSYTWRNVIPFLSPSHLCLAPDLPGMGRSDLILPSGVNSYALWDQISRIEMLVELLEIDSSVILIGHELGGTIAALYARTHPGHVAGLVLIEAAIRHANDGLFEPHIRHLLAEVRSEAGEHLVLLQNRIIEDYLPSLTARRLSSDEMDAYRAPYLKVGESRRAMLSMIRQLPLQTSPSPIDSLVNETRLWCVQSHLPKLLIGGNPGYLVPPSILGTATRWANTSVASVPGLHFLTEDSPARITSLILDWLKLLGPSSGERA